LLVAAAGVALYAESLLTPVPLYDEAIYEAAAEQVHAGASPYTIEDFVYPPVFAHALDGARTLLGELASRLLLRGLNFLALIWLLWQASGWGVERSRLRWRVLICLLLLLVPGVAFAVEYGNLSLLSGALVLAGLLAVESRPVVAGTVLGISFVIKPLVPPALVVLAVPCRGFAARAWLRSPSLIAAAVGGLTAMVVLVAFPLWSGYLRAPIADGLLYRSASVIRVADLLGLPLPRELVLVGVYGAFSLIVWRRRSSARERTIWSLTAVVCGVPLLWPHTFVVFFPVLVAAMATAWSRSLARRGRASETGGPETIAPGERASGKRGAGPVPLRSGWSRAPWWSEVALVACCALAILFFEAANLDLLAPGIQLSLVLPPLIAPLLLAFYLASWGSTESAPPS
jgi:hypothetical protein